MKFHYYYSITITALENDGILIYLKTIKGALLYSRYSFKLYKIPCEGDNNITYVITEELEYLFDFVKLRFPQIQRVRNFNLTELVELNF